LAIELTIDGKPVDLGSVMFQYQVDPYPGGLTYELRAQDSDLMKFLESRLEDGERGPLTGDEVRLVFMGLQLVKNVQALDPNEVKRRKALPLKYWLNTIEKMNFVGDEFRFSGVASPHVQG
jgi:hypothetical protein